MSSAVRADSTTDLTDLPYVLRSAVSLGGLTALLVVVMSFLTRYLAGMPSLRSAPWSRWVAPRR